LAVDPVTAPAVLAAVAAMPADTEKVAATAADMEGAAGIATNTDARCSSSASMASLTSVD
jgi:hypothetical protein